MRISPCKDLLAARGATFRERQGVEVVARLADARAEYDAIRDHVGVTDFSFLRFWRFPAEAGMDCLEQLLAGNVARIRYGRILHTFLASEEGHLVADCYVANNDQELLLITESLVPDAELDAILAAAQGAAAGMEDLTPAYAFFSVDGYQAWQVVKTLFGPDVLGLPYLSVESYPFEGATVRLFRAGKTSEFGYLLAAPVAVAPALLETLAAKAADLGGRLCGVDVHDTLRLEGRFFNLQAEGLRVRDPLILGLQWMVDFEKENFRGAAAIKQRRAAGLQRKVVGVAGAEGTASLDLGAPVYHAGQPVGEVVASCFSHVLNRPVSLAVLPVELAYAGLPFRVRAADGAPVQTISMPPIMPKSLTVKLDEM